MSGPSEPTLTHVTSADGTRIAVFVSGAGRPLVVVPGTTSDHTTWRLAAPLLAPHVTVHAVDRRGRGASGDGSDYSLAKESDDVAAVVDAAAAAAGGPADRWATRTAGTSPCGAASRTANLRRLVLYEGWPTPDVADRTIEPEALERLESLLAEGRREEVLETMYRDVVMMSEEEIAGLKAAPTWPARVAAAPTVPRELRAFGRQAFDPAQAARITVPVLLLVGEDSPEEIQADPDVVAAALPDATLRVLPGQAHIAHLTDPEGFAEQVLAFLR